MTTIKASKPQSLKASKPQSLKASKPQSLKPITNNLLLFVSVTILCLTSGYSAAIAAEQKAEQVKSKSEVADKNYVGIGVKGLYSKPTGTMVGPEVSYTFGNEIKKKISASVLMSTGTTNSEDMNTTQTYIEDEYSPEYRGYLGSTKGFKTDREKAVAALLGFSAGNKKFMAGVEVGGVLIKDNVNYSETEFFHATEGGVSYDNQTVNQNESVKRILPMAGITVEYIPHKNIAIVGSLGYIFGKSNETSPLGAKLDATNGAYGTLGVEIRF